MARSISPAQRAIQITFILKGHLKNVQISYIRAAIQLSKIRDEKLWEALRHRDLEDYAAKRLGLGRSSLYHYLQIHDWLREFHPAWLSPKPKGFIPELSDASALMWIERRLADGRLSDSLRNELEHLRKKALAGALSERELRALRGRLRTTATPLRAALDRLRSFRRAADRIPRFPERGRVALDEAIRAVAESLGSSGEVARLTARRAKMVARLASGPRRRAVA
jgi:hypothetical protein